MHAEHALEVGVHKGSCRVFCGFSDASSGCYKCHKTLFTHALSAGTTPGKTICLEHISSCFHFLRLNDKR